MGNKIKSFTANQKADQVFLQKILHGFVETERSEDGAFRLFRVPATLLPKLDKQVYIRSYHAAGSELRFRMNGSPVRLTIRRIMDPGLPQFTRQTLVPIGIFHGDFQYTWIALQEGDNVIEIKPFQFTPDRFAQLKRRFSPTLTRIVLPPYVEMRIVDWEGELEPPRPGDEPDRQLLSYGSSITQGAYSPLGTETYPAILARELGLDVWNLGFGGGAVMEPELAEWIVSRTDWHLATLEMGVNVLSMLPDEFRSRVRKFLSFFAADPLKRPVFSLDMLPFGNEFHDGEKDNAKAASFRKIVREETMAYGQPRMRVLEYSSLLPEPFDFTSDLLHPAAHAFETIGRGLAEQIKSGM